MNRVWVTIARCAARAGDLECARKACGEALQRCAKHSAVWHDIMDIIGEIEDRELDDVSAVWLDTQG